MKVLTDNFRRRLARANTACRELRRQGFRILACAVDAGDALTKSRIVVGGGDALAQIAIEGCIVTRRIGRAS